MPRTLMDFLEHEVIPYDNTPHGLVVQDHLFLFDTDVTELPDNLTVQGDLNIVSSSITRLPYRLSVGRNLVVSASSIDALPARLSVGRDLRLLGTMIQDLPEGFRVQGGLRLTGSPVARLPEGLHVAGDLDLSSTPITRLPASLYVGGIIHPPDGLRDMIAYMDKDVEPEIIHVGSGDRRHLRVLTPHEQDDGILAMPASHHARMNLLERLIAFPDLLRIVASLPPDDQLRIRRTRQGGILSQIEPRPES